MKKYTFLLLFLITTHAIFAGKKVTLLGYYGIAEDAKKNIPGKNKTVKQFVEEQYTNFLTQFSDDHKQAWAKTMEVRSTLLLKLNKKQH